MLIIESMRELRRWQRNHECEGFGCDCEVEAICPYCGQGRIVAAREAEEILNQGCIDCDKKEPLETVSNKQREMNRQKPIKEISPGANKYEF